jgi:AcrR family transcriptional regulator
MREKFPSTADRRVQRTRRALRDAMIALIMERGWDGFGVQELCARADVARSTFYVHFADKEEVLGGSFDDLRRFIRAQVAAGAAPARPLAFTRGLVEHGHEQRRLFLAVVGKRSGMIVHRKFRALVLELVREDLEPLLAAGPRRAGVVAFVAGALLEVLTWSLEARSPPTPEETDALFQELVAPALAAAMARAAPAR